MRERIQGRASPSKRYGPETGRGRDEKPANEKYITQQYFNAEYKTGITWANVVKPCKSAHWAGALTYLR